MSRQALELALEALEYPGPSWLESRQPAISAIKEALAKLEQEPVAKVTSETGDPDITMSWWHEPALPVGTPLYTTPPQRTWVGLTDEEIKEGESKGELGHGFIQGALWAEAKLKDKNEN